MSRAGQEYAHICAKQGNKEINYYLPNDVLYNCAYCFVVINEALDSDARLTTQGINPINIKSIADITNANRE